MYKVTSLGLLLSMVFATMPVASYRLMINELGKVALIYGDYHNIQLDEYNECHAQLLFDTIKGAPDFKKINCITGLLENNSANIISVAAKTFHYIEINEELVHERVLFQKADPRDERITACLRAFMYECERKLNTQMSLNTLGRALFDGMPIVKESKI